MFYRLGEEICTIRQFPIVIIGLLFSVTQFKFAFVFLVDFLLPAI